MAGRNDVEPVRGNLRATLIRAMKARDAATVEAVRSLLAAIDNAEAPDVSHAPPAQAGTFAGGVAGLGAGEVDGRELSTDDVESLVRAEIADRRAAAVHFDVLGRSDDAARMTATAAVLEAILEAILDERGRR